MAVKKLKRFDIEAAVNARTLLPPRVVIHGDEKTGKSTFACSAPGTIALDIENRISHIDVDAWKINSWDDIFSALESLRASKHEYKMVAIDTASALEPLVKKHIVEGHFRGDERKAESYSAWVRVSLTHEWPRFFCALERLVMERNMGWVITCHSAIKSIKDPRGHEYQRFVIALQGQVPGIFRHNCDDLGFVTKEDFFVQTKGSRHARTSTSGVSIVHWTHSPAYEAGNSHGLPSEMPLDWNAYEGARDIGWNRLPELMKKARVLIKQIKNAQVVRSATDHIRKNKTNVNIVESAVNRMRAIIEQQNAEKAKEEES